MLLPKTLTKAGQALLDSDTSVGKALRFGIDQPTENIATTLEALNFDTQAQAMRGWVDAPENYESAAARFMKPEGEWYDFNWSDLPLATVEQAGQLGGSMALRLAGLGAGSVAGSPILGAVLAIGGPALFESLQIAGPMALERAKNDKPPREEPDIKDWAAVLPFTVFSGLLNALGVGGFKPLNTLIPKLPKLPGGAAIGEIGKTVTSTLGGGLREGVTEGLQALTEQAGGTFLTDKGLTLEPKQALGEALIGTSTGTTIQAPVATAQAIKNMMKTVSPPLSEAEQIREMLQQPVDIEDEIRDMPVERQQTYRDLAIQNIEILEEQATPEVVEDTEQSPVELFLESQAPIIDQYIEAEVLPNNDFTEVEMMTIRSQVNDFIGTNFDLFDPTTATNSPNTTTTLILGQIDEAVEARKRQVQEKIITSEADRRFEAPMNPVENIWLDSETQQPKIAEGPRAEGIASLMSQGIDPVFLIKGKLIPHLQNLPNKPMSAEQAMEYLSIKQTDNWFAPRSGISQTAGARAREAIDSGVANFLRNRKANNQPVTKEEIAAVFNDWLGRFRTVKSQTVTQGGEHIANLGELSTPHGTSWLYDMETIPGFTRLENSALWTMYDARGPVIWEESGGRESSNPYLNPLSDSTHNPYGKGTVFWNRGPIVIEEGIGTGVVLGEGQSQIHEYAQDATEHDEIYRSKVIEEDSPEMESIGKRINALEEAQRAVVEPLERWGAAVQFTGYGGPDQQGARQNLTYITQRSSAKYVVSTITEVLKGDLNKNLTSFQRRQLYSMLELVSPEYANLKNALNTKTSNRAIEILIESLIEDQPYGTLGVELTPAKIQLALDEGYFKGNPTTIEQVWYAVDKYVEKQEGVELSLGETQAGTPEGQEIKAATQAHWDLKNAADRLAAEEFRGDNTNLARDYLPKLAEVIPEINNINFVVRGYPTQEEVNRYNTWTRREQRNVVPDYPFKKNWPRMTLITDIVNALDNPTLDFVYIIEKPYGGPPKAYSDIHKAAKNIANQFGDKGVTLTEVPNTQGFEGGKVHRLDIRPIREMVRNGTFPGFEGGYKYGGLVTKAQGAGYSINYGDYGRSYT